MKCGFQFVFFFFVFPRIYAIATGLISGINNLNLEFKQQLLPRTKKENCKHLDIYKYKIDSKHVFNLLNRNEMKMRLVLYLT